METTPAAKPTGSDRFDHAYRAWAADNLDLDPTLSPDELRQAALKKLRDEDFELWDSGDLATRILTLPEIRAGSDLDRFLLAEAEEKVCREELKALSGKFLDSTLETFRDEIDGLREDCAKFPALRHHLRKLEAAANLRDAIPAVEDPRVQQLVSRLCGLSASWPREQGEYYRKRIAPLLDEQRVWRPAAMVIRAKYPDVAALSPVTVSRLISGRDTSLPSKTSAAEVGRSWGLTVSGQNVKIAATEEDENAKRWGVFGFLSIFVAVGGLHLITSLTTTKTPRASVPKIVMPSVSPRNNQPIAKFPVTELTPVDWPPPVLGRPFEELQALVEPGGLTTKARAQLLLYLSHLRAERREQEKLRLGLSSNQKDEYQRREDFVQRLTALPPIREVAPADAMKPLNQEIGTK